MTQSDKIKYSVVEGWEQLPKGFAHRDVAGVAVDGEDRVYLICRGDNPVIIYDTKATSYAPGAKAISPIARMALVSIPTARFSAPTTAITRCVSTRPRANC